MIAQHSSKAQMEMTETIAVLLIFFVLLALGSFFFYRYYIDHIRAVSEETLITSSSVLLASITSLPEIKCANKDCVDTVKLFAFKELIEENKDYYFTSLGYKNIIVEQIYPVINSKEECTITKFNNVDYPNNCKYWKLYNKRPSTFKANPKISTPISLYFPDSNEYRIGRLIIEAYI